MAAKAHAGMRATDLFPQQAHQPVALRPSAAGAVTAGGEQQAGLLRLQARTCQLLVHALRPCLHQQGVTGVHVIVGDRRVGKPLPRRRGDFSQLGPLQKAEVEHGGNQEDVAFAGRRFIGQNRCQV